MRITEYENSLNNISLKYQHFNLGKVGVFILALIVGIRISKLFDWKYKILGVIRKYMGIGSVVQMT